MKRINRIVSISLFGLIFWIIPIQTNAQIAFDIDENFYEITDYWDNYYDSLSVVLGSENLEGTGYKHYMHWKTKWEPKVYPSGDFLLYFQLVEDSYECFQSLGYYDVNGTWDELGPITSSQPECNADDVGRLACIAVDPLNDSIILTGSPVGGLYYTEDYGEHWINGGLDNPNEDYGFEMFTPGIASIIIIHDADTTWWYIATGDKDDNWSQSRGVIRSKDKGITWEHVSTGLDIGLWNYIRKIIVHPDNPNYIFAATTKGIFRTQNALNPNPGFVEWTKVLKDEPDISNTNKVGFFDIEFSHTNPRKIIATKEYTNYENIEDGEEIWWTNDPYGEISTWDTMPNISQILPDTGINWGKFKIMLETTPADPNIMYAYALNRASSKYHKFFKYSFDTGNWVFLSNANSSANTGRTAFAVSPVSADTLYYGFIRPYFSNDGGLNWVKHHDTIMINGEDKNYPHSDIHDIVFSNDGSSIWAATDGGPFVSKIDTSNDWDNKVNDIGIAVVHYFDQSKIDPDYYLFGGYDAHSQLKVPDHDYWDDIGGGDGYGCAFDNEDLGTFYASNSYVVYRFINWQFDGSFNPPGGNFWDRHVAINPRANKTIYTSNGDAIYRSFNQGSNSTWDKIADSNMVSPPYGQTFYDMHTAEGDSNYLYLRVANAKVNHTDKGKHARIYKTTNVNETIATDIVWELITPYPGIEAWPTDIEVDYEDPDKIWVSYSSSTGQKIFEYENSTWTNITWNLDECNTGINSLAHLHGTDGSLFAGGRHGIFYLEDGSDEWILFKPGIPNTKKTNLKINYCTGKIVSGTYGRGIWETDLPTGWDDAPEIMSNETWDGYRVILNPVIIPDGITLTITGKVAFTANGKIIVESGGQLIIDGGLLTNTCGNSWQGILVYGHSGQAQDYTYQGLVAVLNGGTIENAVCGVSTIKYSTPGNPEDDLTPDYYYTGGIVRCDDALFKNNQTAVKFWDYSFDESESFFRDCQFITDDQLLADIDPNFFIEMTDISGIKIQASTFTDTRTMANPIDLTSGVLAYDGHFEVFNSGSQNCIFTGLYYGIKAYAHGPGKFISIKNTSFDDNSRGVYISGMSNAEITDNNFNINSPYSSFNGGYGLYLDHSTAYKVEDNNFYHNGENAMGLGLVVNESGGDPNIIYRNYFLRLECGMDLQGENRAKDGIGLELKCNEYSRTLMDKIVTWDDLFVTSTAGIAKDQGSSSSSPEDMAGNLFYVPGPSNNDFDDVLNEANNITYYYPINNDDDRVIPVDYTHNTVDLISKNILGGWSYETGCPPTEEPGGGGGIGVIKGKMAVAENKTDSTENILALLIDGGNTEATQTDVDNSIPPETMQVYNELMDKSPYLSDTVVSTAIEKEDVLPAAMLRDIMVANPNTAKSENLMQKLDERWDPLPEYMKAQILAGRSIVSIREETESRLAAFKLESEKHFNALSRYYINDTIDPVGSMDSLIVLYENKNSLSAKYSLAFISGEHGEWSIGLAILNGIPVQFELNAKQANTHTQMLAYYTILSDLAQEDKSVLQVNAAQIAQLQSIEATIKGRVSAYSRNILLALGEIDYEEPIIFPDMLKSSSSESEYEDMLSKAAETPNYIKVRPNPSKDYIILAYELEKEGGATIDIHNINAKLEFTKNLINRQDQFTIDTREWKVGVYIITLKINGNLVESVKFTVIN